MVDVSGIESFGDIIKKKTSRKGAQERLDLTEELLSSPEEWVGNPERAEELDSLMYPNIGTKLHPSVMQEQIDLQSRGFETLEELASSTYARILEEDPNTAEEFRKATHIDFDGEKQVRDRVNSILSDPEAMGFTEDQAVKEAFTVVNQTAYELDGSEFNGNYLIDLRENRTLEQQLSDEVFSRLEGEAQAFFDYARREDAPEGVHSNFNIDAQPADNYDPKQVLEEKARQLKQDFTSSSDSSEVIENHENFYDVMNVAKLVERAGLGHRFDINDKENYQEDAEGYVGKWIERITSMKEENISYSDSLMKDLESANEYAGPDREEMGEKMTEKVDAVLGHVDYLKDQINGGLDGNLRYAQERLKESREPEERDSGFLNRLLN